ncbi:bifunctional 2-keto-4-hydroxyglutarate aldolase/2-keto-3-deoxy-6-phosphogluconate aldolase [Peptoniphilus equinus]|uniref:Bifunctional 2-keto-4-hydroxyglutarate aldolase/2-keto-3-deoxy-6-phosphogluconate aldolase n=1 Tax=Peptoniphilus equinus TaxID=3016343 RepID=A0ABY7QTV7_9FIRM|nr:bifunctional 2-keto-4-hydroxyglutarate aldolase/2-keto-3-deoxy-6-phosphogluconate aldolase [Peptoniphilus equinus]WBW50209.1 bifunctional 2-keto-4-hydroxyglutarate aldolase/2-keto-3-deoxy-6-phosphogluconate aldolase [Peptoniphilus equinus]
MSKLDTLLKIKNLGIVAVVRGNSAEEALEYAEGCIDGGIDIIEITFTIPNAIEVLKTLQSSLQGATIGAGTVLDAVTARLAIMAGAQFIVSPAFDEDVAKLCNRYQVPYMPGCLSVNEILKALEYGVDVIKVFPGSAVGPDYIKAVHGPLPHVNLMPTGGVSLENIDEWFRRGVFAVGVGSNLVSGSKEDIAGKAEAYLEAIREVRK